MGGVIIRPSCSKGAICSDAARISFGAVEIFVPGDVDGEAADVTGETTATGGVKDIGVGKNGESPAADFNAKAV